MELFRFYYVRTSRDCLWWGQSCTADWLPIHIFILCSIFRAGGDSALVSNVRNPSSFTPVNTDKNEKMQNESAVSSHNTLALTFIMPTETKQSIKVRKKIETIVSSSPSVYNRNNRIAQWQSAGLTIIRNRNNRIAQWQSAGLTIIRNRNNRIARWQSTGLTIIRNRNNKIAQWQSAGLTIIRNRNNRIAQWQSAGLTIIRTWIHIPVTAGPRCKYELLTLTSAQKQH